MKLFWKQFLGILCMVLVLFSVFGSMLLYSSFQMSLNQEKNRISEEIGVFQYAMISSLQSIPKEYEAVDYAVSQIGDSIVKSQGNKKDIIKIYDSEGNLVFESNKSVLDIDSNGDKNSCYRNQSLRDWLDGNEEQGSYEIVEKKEGYFLTSLSMLKSNKGNYCLEINRNISFLFENRERLYGQYKLILVVVVVISAILTFLLSMFFTRPILRLSKETKSFASGNYESRVQVRGNDEVTTLMEDFNQMADSLCNTMTELEKRVLQQEEFTAAFAHELKTPLTSIIGYGDMLRMMELSSEDCQACGNYIFQQGKRLEILSKKMLELTGIGKQNLQYREISINGLLSKAYEMLQTSFAKKDIQWNCNMEESMVWGDEDLLLSLVCNLLDNSRKACDKQGIITCVGKKVKEGYMFSVEDNGRGIPDEELDKIKEAFYMVDKSRARNEGGAGLGMALCEKIVKVHKGWWQIESELGIGTTITICLPDNENVTMQSESLEEMEVQEIE